MTNEEMQRKMEFIVEHQAHFAASIQRMDEERVRDRARVARLEESFQTLVALAEVADERLDKFDSITQSLEESVKRLVVLSETTDKRLARLESRNN